MCLIEIFFWSMKFIIDSKLWKCLLNVVEIVCFIKLLIRVNMYMIRNIVVNMLNDIAGSYVI